MSYEQLVARAEGRVAPSDRFAVESHLRQCQSCTEELADLTQFRAGITKKPANWRWVMAAAAAIVLVAFTGTLFRRAPVRIADDWGKRDLTIAEQVLRAGKLPEAQPQPDLVSKTGTLLGPSTPNLFAPLGPLATVVESDRPEFSWQELAGAASYRLEVYDANFQLVASSPELTATTWTPSQPLERGKLYQWQVSAVRNGEKVTVPSPPAPDAKFRVLDGAEEERIAQARTQGPMGHVLAAALLAQGGMKAEAAAEVGSLPPDLRARLRQ